MSRHSVSGATYHITHWALEACLFLSVALVSLLYTPLSSDNILAKLGLLHMLAGPIVLFSCLLLAQNGRVRLLRLPMYPPLLAFTLLSLLSAGFSHNPVLGAESSLTSISMFAIFLVAAHYYRSSSRIDRLLWVLAATSLTVSVIGLLQCRGIDFLGVVEKYRLIPVSTLGNPNSAAHYHELMLPVLMAGLISRWRSLRYPGRVAFFLAILMSAAHLIAAQSRAGWLSLAVALPLLFVLAATRRIRWSPNAPIWGVIALLLIPIGRLAARSVPFPGGGSLHSHMASAFDQTLDRAMSVFDPTDYTRQMRVLIWRDSVRMIKASPALGVGPGQYRVSLPAYADHDAWRRLVGEARLEPRRAHNEYLHVTAETGLLGGAAMVWLLGSLMWLGARYLKSLPRSGPDGHTHPVRAMTAGILCGLIATLLHACVSFNLHDPVASLHFWLLAGAMVGLNCGRPGADDRSVDVEIPSLARIGVAASAGIIGPLLFGVSGLGILLGDYYYARSLESLEAGYLEPSIVILRLATHRRSYEPRYHHILAQAHLEARQYQEARASLQRCLILNPSNAGALRLLGRLMVRAGDDDNAIGVLTRSLDIYRFSAPGYALLSQAYRHAGEVDLAMAALERGLEAMPYEPELLAAMALAHGEAGQWEASISLLKQAARFSPRDSRIAGNLGTAHLQAGNLNRAETHLRRALRLNPRSRAVWEANLATTLARQSRALRLRNRHVEAQLTADEALRLAPDDPEVQELHQAARQRR